MATGDNAGGIKASAAGLDMNSKKGINAADGAAATDFATKGQMDTADALKVPATRTVSTAGIATGGGALSGDLTITVAGTLGAVDNVVPRSDGTGAKTFQSSALVIDDTGVASGVTFADPTAAQQPATQGYVDRVIIQVAVATTTALAAYTYANGSSGVGATITANGNGAIAAINGYTPVLNDLILVKTGVALSDCGPYQLTTVGTGGTPFVLTRSTLADTAAKLALIKGVMVTGGIGANRGELYELQTTPGAIVVGTTALLFLRTARAGQYTSGFLIVEDFKMGANAPATGAVTGDTNIIVTYTGTTSAVTTNSNSGTGNTATEIGIATFNTGTLATGNAAINMNGVTCNMWGLNNAVFISTRFNIPVASTGAQQHRVSVAGAAIQASCVSVKMDAVVNANFQLDVKSATAGGTTTVTGASGPSGGTTYDEVIVWKDAGSSQVQWAINAVAQTNPATTNTPLSDLTTAYMEIQKLVGITTQSLLKVDWLVIKVALAAERAA